jgi:hypothetical protein
LGQFRAFVEAILTNDMDELWNEHRTRLQAMGKAKVRETCQFSLESESGQCGVSHETSSEESGYVAVAQIVSEKP